MSDTLSTVDKFQIIKYRKMLGLTNLETSATFVNVIQSSTIKGKLNIQNNAIFNNNATINNNLNIMSNFICNKNITSFGVLLSDNIQINNAVTFTGNIKSNNIYIGGNINLGNDGIINTMIINSGNLNNISYFNNSIIVNNIFQNKTTINIISDNINLGNPTSIIKFNGSELNFNANETKIYDNILTLNDSFIYNVNNESIGIDDGNNAGFIIKSNITDGYIILNDNLNRFKIKAPKDNDYRYIATTDINNDFIISGNTILHGNNTIMSKLIVNGNTTIVGNTDFNSSLILSGNTLFNNNVSIINNLNLKGNVIVNKKSTLMSNLNIAGNANFKDAIIESNLEINGNSLIYGNLTCNSTLNMSGISVFNGIININKDLSIKDDLLISGNVTVLSTVKILHNCNIDGNMNIEQNIIISNKSNLNGNTTFLSDFNVSNNIIINGDMTIGSLITSIPGYLDTYNPSEMYNIEILGKIICSLNDYENNTAAVNAGLPLWCLYRTGGILKIRLDNTPPTIILHNNDDIYIKHYNNLIISGGYAIDNVNNNIDVYIYSIYNSNTSNVINKPYIITSLNSSINFNINEINGLSIGTYYILYNAIDSEGNEGTIQKTLHIIPEELTYYYNLTNIEQSNITSSYIINNNNLITRINFTDISFTFNRTLIQDIDFNKEWSFIVKLKALSWGDIFQINFDPSFIDWDNRVKLRENIGLTNISFRYGQKYFYTTDTYWQNVSYNQDFYTNINNTGVYIKIYKNNNGNVGIIIYNDNGNIIDNVISINPINYITKQSFCTFTSFVDLTWFGGFVIHKSDSGVNVNEFKNAFNN